jgi:translation initiation factor 1 (eIF-1/SUI1)
MNPFNNDDKDNNESIFQLTKDNLIEIWNDTRGKKSDTYISGLPLDKKELLVHLKYIKKTQSCNGSIKETTDENNNNSYIFHIQGNQIDFLKKYFNEIGFNTIKLKG